MKIRRRMWLYVAAVLLSVVIYPSGVHAAGEPTLTVSGGSSFFTEGGGAISVDPSLTISGSGDVAGAKVSISGGYVEGQDTLSFTPQYGITGIFDVATGVLSVAGTATAAQYQDVLRSVRYDNFSGTPDAGNRTITFSLGQNSLYYSDTGHYYEFVTVSGITWTEAKTRAEAKGSYGTAGYPSGVYGMQGYLATITSAGENDFAFSKLNGQGWIGASDAATEGDWRWVTGPEAGTAFFLQTGADPSSHNLAVNGGTVYTSSPGGGDPVGGYYNNWASGEPNDWGSAGENYAHYRDDGTWNDFAYDNSSIAGYVVEYGGTPGDPVLQLAGSKTVTVVTVSAVPDQGMTEANLDGRTVTLTLSGDTYAASLDPAGFTLNNVPTGTTVRSVSRTDATHADVVLAYNGTDFDSNVATFSVTVAGSQLALGNPLISNAMTITAVAETAPTVTTTDPVTSITVTAATAGGNVSSDGGGTVSAAVTERGVVYSTGADPTTADSKITAPGTTGAFTVNLSGLTPSTTYHVRAYATNSVGTSYGGDVSFATATPPAPTTANTSNNVLSANPVTITVGGSITLTAAGDRQDASGVVSGDERYVPATWTSTESGKSGSFTESGGTYRSSYMTNATGSYTVTATFQKQIYDGAAWVSSVGGIDTKTVRVAVSAIPIDHGPSGGSSSGGSTSGSSSGGSTSGSSSGGSTSGSSSGGSTSGSSSGAPVIVNGVTYIAGTAADSTRDDESVTTVTVDSAKLQKTLDTQGSEPSVIIPVTSGADIAAGVLTGQMVRDMEDKSATLTFQTNSASYTIPSDEIHIDTVAERLGQSVPLSEITVGIEIAQPPASTVTLVESAAKSGDFEVRVPALDFTINCTYGSKTVDVEVFDAYVQRMVLIPDGVDSEKITTGVVVKPDGTTYHVPTRVTVIDGQYYAVLNSLTNSTYTVVWHPLEFSDVADHWAKDAVNDMGSRMVVTGVGDNLYAPDRNITRAEFAAVIVRALGLDTGMGENHFADVSESDWCCGYVQTATAYGIIEGYDANTFGPNDIITREQAMTMVARAMKITGLKPDLTDDEIADLLARFADSSEASDYARGSIAAGLETGVVNGTSDNMIAPKDFITRAEAAALVQRLLKKSRLI